jgi:hypothetical protein
MATSASTTWREVLADTSGVVIAIERALAAGWTSPEHPATTTGTSWTAPDAVGPPPPALRDQALELLRRLTEVEVAVAEGQRALLAQIAAEAGRDPRRDPRRADGAASIIDWRV